MHNRIGTAVRTALAAAPLVVWAGPASAEDMFDVAFGAAATSDYVARGITQTDGGPAVQGYVELDAGILYANVWASNVDFAGVEDAEIDLAVGITPEFGAWSFDLGYVHYVYANNSAPAFGELYALTDYAVGDNLSLGADLYFAPDWSQGGASAFYGEVNTEISLPANFSLSGGVGYQSFDAALGLPNYLTWNAGVSWVWSDTVTFDLRYTDSDLGAAECSSLMAANACGARVMASIAVDTSWSALKGGN